MRLRWLVALGACVAMLGGAAAVTDPARAGVARGSAAAVAGAPPAVDAAAAVLMDVRTGRVLYALEPHRRLAPASTTKILTAILVLERLSLSAPVTISARAATQRDGAAIGLAPGEQWTVDELLHVMLLKSANDAAVALAEAAAGSVEQFVSLMNTRARHLGARNSQFVTPHGLDRPDHYSTAYDLAVIARYGLHHPVFAALVRTRAWVLQRPGREPQEVVTTNRFLARYEGADGVKTGWTARSGPCLVASATRGGWQLLAVVLNSPEVVSAAERLLDYGFVRFEPVRVAAAGQRLATVVVGRRGARVEAVLAADLYAVVPRGTPVASRVVLRQPLSAPVSAGAVVGQVEAVAGGTVVARAPLVAARGVPR
ncbi:MAG: D-alanyl-D-alanine carboxypeptidase family protein [Armatimonadota bacterium]|nr:D-alanyl-D-alanine carboxypeptidase family protein [Armatimonadota bacterium]